MQHNLQSTNIMCIIKLYIDFIDYKTDVPRGNIWYNFIFDTNFIFDLKFNVIPLGTVAVFFYVSAIWKIYFFFFFLDSLTFLFIIEDIVTLLW